MPLEYQSLKDNKAAMAGQFYKQNLLHLTIYTVFEKYLKFNRVDTGFLKKLMLEILKVFYCIIITK